MNVHININLLTTSFYASSVIIRTIPNIFTGRLLRKTKRTNLQILILIYTHITPAAQLGLF